MKKTLGLILATLVIGLFASFAQADGALASYFGNEGVAVDRGKLWFKESDASFLEAPVPMLMKVTVSDCGVTTAVTNTGSDLPAGSLILGCYLNVSTAPTTGTSKTIDVGLLSSESGGDDDGFLDGVSVATTGVKKGTLLSSGQTLGALLRVDESGGGVLVPEPHVTATATSIVYACGSADWTASCDFDIYILYLDPN